MIEKIKSKYKAMTRGGKIFMYSMLAAVLIIVVAGIVVSSILSDFLFYYEQSRPSYVASESFEKLFLSGDRASLYGTMGEQLPAAVGKDEFAESFSELVSGRELSYKEVSNGLSDDRKYSVIAGDEIIGYFTLKPSGIRNKKNFDIYVFDSAELIFPNDRCYVLRVEAGSEVYIGGKRVPESYIAERGSLIAGEYEIYKLPWFSKLPDYRVTKNGNNVALEHTEGTKLSSAALFGQISTVKEDIVTVRAKSESKVLINGMEIGKECIIPSAHGSVSGFYKGSEALEFDIYVYNGIAESVKVVDPDGNERELQKLIGGNVYSDPEIESSGKLEFMVISTSKPTLSGYDVPDSYIVEEKIATRYSKYMPEGVLGIRYKKYSLTWVGTQPSLSVTNSYGVPPEMIYENGVYKEVLHSDEELQEEYEELLIEVACTIGKIMTRESGYYFVTKMKQYLVEDSVAYNTFQENMIYAQFYQKHKSYGFRNIVTGNYYKHGEGLFSAQISLTQYVITNDDKEITYDYNYTFYFVKSGDKYLIYDYENEGTMPIDIK